MDWLLPAPVPAMAAAMANARALVLAGLPPALPNAAAKKSGLVSSIFLNWLSVQVGNLALEESLLELAPAVEKSADAAELDPLAIADARDVGSI